jgi:hypothetical protein
MGGGGKKDPKKTQTKKNPRAWRKLKKIKKEIFKTPVC